MAQIAPGNSLGISMNHVHIMTPNPELHRKLWVDVLGGKPMKIGSMEGAMFPGALVIYSKAESQGGSDGSVVDHFGFAVPDLDATRSKLIAAGIKIIRELPDTKQFFAAFPTDVKVEFSQIAGLDVPIKYHHVHFATNDADAMREWYGKQFGAVLGTRGKFKAADIPGANLTWLPTDTPRLPTKGRAVDHIGFQVKDLAAFCKRLEAANIKMDTPPTRVDDAHVIMAFFTDPWGTRIQLTQDLP